MLHYQEKDTIKQERPKVQSSGQSLCIQFFEAIACSMWESGILVESSSETDIGEQGQSVADIANDELFHGLGLLS
jgi:hypothetical protein